MKRKTLIKNFNFLAKKYNFSNVALSMRESFSADHNDWSGLFYDNKNVHSSKKYEIQIVDKSWCR